jgi:RHS repeat-associated protein
VRARPTGLTIPWVTNSVTKTFSYAYNYDGSLASLTYPSGRQITYLPGGAGRPLNAVDSGSGINYVTAAHYSPSGALSALQNGASLSSAFLYDSRLQPCWIYATTGTPLPTNTLCSGTAATGNVLDLKYNFSLGTADNGNVMGITNTREASHHRDQSFTYDSLNRIATAATLDWSQTFTIDIWANLYNVVATGGAPGLSQTVGANNRLSGLGYDVAGDTTNDGLYNYVYDAEGRNCSVGGTTCANGTMYSYDGDGKRVKKSTGTLYWYGGGSDVLLETDLSGGLQNEYIFFGGKRVARRDATGTVYYYFADHLGSSRVITNATGTVCYEADFYPYGGERAVTTTCSQNYKFTGKERDTETQNDYFGARFHESNLGRFTVPDPGPFIWTDPQTLNRYTYTRNNPVRHWDPNGKFQSGDHEMMQVNVMLAVGYSPRAAQVAAAANTQMDNWKNMFSGVQYLHKVVPTQENPQHGERADRQTREQAQAVAKKFIESKTSDAATKALNGDATGALKDLGQASHTAQDIVRHDFEPASQHPLVEEVATPQEQQAAAQTTRDVLDEFTAQMYVQGLQQGLSFTQIAAIKEDVSQDVDTTQPPCSNPENKPGGRGPCR